jgi:hypothetical protein
MLPQHGEPWPAGARHTVMANMTRQGPTMWTVDLIVYGGPRNDPYFP